MVPQASILLLPSEIKCLIVDLVSSSESPTSSTPTRSLAALARTHSAFQREAERALYGTLFIYAFTNKSLKCMETLATNQEKAALVRFLSIVYTCFNKTTKLMNQILRTYLSKILINMHSLSDFRVKSLPGGREAEGEMMRGLGKILCEGHFRLHSLFCRDAINISQIIKSQTELQILGLYTSSSGSSRSMASILETLKEFHDAQLFLPIVCVLHTVDLIGMRYHHLNIFPAFYSVNRRASIPQILARFFSKDQYSLIDCIIDIHELSIFWSTPPISTLSIRLQKT